MPNICKYPTKDIVALSEVDHCLIIWLKLEFFDNPGNCNLVLILFKLTINLSKSSWICVSSTDWVCSNRVCYFYWIRWMFPASAIPSACLLRSAEAEQKERSRDTTKTNAKDLVQLIRNKIISRYLFLGITYPLMNHKYFPNQWYFDR